MPGMLLIEARRTLLQAEVARGAYNLSSRSAVR